LVVKDRKLSMTLLVQHYVQEQGFALYAIDHVGHGYSEGTRALIRDYRHNRDDLHNYCEQVSKQNPDLPLFLMGYSYGATLVLQVAAKYKDQPKLAGIILLASFLRGDIPNFVKIFVLRYLLTPLMPTSSPFFMPRPMTSERLWRDEDVLRINTSQARRKIDVCGKPYRLLTAVQLLEASHEVLNESIPSLQAPFVALHGTQDDGCPVRDLDYLRNNPCGSIVLLEGAHHDLLADPAAEETLEHADAFIQKRLEQVKREM
jgi:alpha-beta hydrolase superfamily lysophospholipase